MLSSEVIAGAVETAMYIIAIVCAIVGAWNILSDRDPREVSVRITLIYVIITCVELFLAGVLHLVKVAA